VQTEIDVVGCNICSLLSTSVYGIVEKFFMNKRGYCVSVERGAGSGNYCLNFINIGIPLNIEILMADIFKNSIFGENWELLLWIQKTFQPS
jgi:hypothetical protein